MSSLPRLSPAALTTAAATLTFYPEAAVETIVFETPVRSPAFNQIRRWFQYFFTSRGRSSFTVFLSFSLFGVTFYFLPNLTTKRQALFF